MPAPRPETLVRPTDIVADTAQDRLGNSGSELFDDLISRVNQGMGLPLEVKPTPSPSTQLIVGAAQYLLPDGQRQAVFSDGAVASLVSGTIDFSMGTIVGGAVSGFSLPLLNPGDYVKALIEYEVDSDSLNVSFGNPNGILSLSSVPVADAGYVALALAELHSTGGGTGVFDAIDRTKLIQLLDFSGGSGEVVGPREEKQTVVTPQTVFTLTLFKIPADRKKLTVFVNGIRNVNIEDYNVTSDTEVTFVDIVPVGAEVEFRLN